MSDLLQIEGRPSGPLATNTYRLTDPDSGDWALVDATYNTLDAWRSEIDARPPAAIFLTHGHFDHIAGLAEILDHLPAPVPVWIHPDSEPMLADANLNGAAPWGFPYTPAAATDRYREPDTVHLGPIALQVIDAPGHCPGSVMLRAGRQLIGGDVLFQGATGRWDLPGADYDTLARSVREKVMTLPDDTVVYPGHGPVTTVGEERRSNFIVQRMLAGLPVD